MITFLTGFHPGNQIGKNKMGGACCTYGEDSCLQSFGGEA
jgi:hypothetical protein